MGLELRYLAPIDAADPHSSIAAAIEVVRAINSHQPSDDEIRELLELSGIPGDVQAIARIRRLSTPSKESMP